MINATQVTISPPVIAEIASLVPPDLSEQERHKEIEYWIQEVILAAKRFIEHFRSLPEFFNREPYHEFDGIVVHDKTTGRVTHRIPFLIQYAHPEVGIFSHSEIRLREDYHVQKVIAESHFPEYQKDLWPQFYERK